MLVEIFSNDMFLMTCRLKEGFKVHSLSEQFCTRVPFSKNDSGCQLWLAWKGLVRRIPFSRNEDHADTVYKVNGL